MPYIKKDERVKFENMLGNIPPVFTPGELNYLITKILLAYEEQHGAKYQTYNDIIGVLGCCHSEFYARVVVPFEGYKQHMNGDVYNDYPFEEDDYHE